MPSLFSFPNFIPSHHIFLDILESFLYTLYCKDEAHQALQKGENRMKRPQVRKVDLKVNLTLNLTIDVVEVLLLIAILCKVAQ